MSTRSVIAKPRGHGVPPIGAKPVGFINKLMNRSPRPQFEGVYHHNGGSPSNMGPILWNLMRHRYKLRAEEFWREMIYGNPAGWSSLGCFWPPAQGNPTNFAVTWDGKTKTNVDEDFKYFQGEQDPPGPCSYQGDPKRHYPGITDMLITEDSDKRMAVFVYVVTPEELVIMLVDENDQALEKARVPWQGPEPDWDALDSRMDDDEDGEDEADEEDEETGDEEDDDADDEDEEADAAA